MSSPSNPSWETEEGLDALLRSARLAPKIPIEDREQMLSAVMAPGAALATERLEEALERADLAPRIPPSRRAAILQAAMRDGAPASERLGRWLRAQVRWLSIAVPAAAAAVLLIVLVRPGSEVGPEGPAPSRAIPYIGAKGAMQPPPTRRFQARLRLVRMAGDDLRPVGEALREAPRVEVPPRAELALTYASREGRLLFAYVGLLEGKTLRPLTAPDGGPFRLAPGTEEGLLEVRGGPSFSLRAGASAYRLIVVVGDRQAKVPPAELLAAAARKNALPPAAGLSVVDILTLELRLSKVGR